ncbi:MAG TPA: tetratricopeptide repeat protein, partial [Longimicrobium sp.]|nr:tetratricopeptide repeat protein [Longimicrobium sp.]
MEASASVRPLTLDDARALRAAGDWRALAERGAATPAQVLAAEPEVAYAYAAACRHLGDPGRAVQLAELARDEARRHGNRLLTADAVNLIGNAWFEQGRLDDAECSFAELLEVAAEWADEEFTARASNNLGVISNVRGRRDLALGYYERAAAAYQRNGNFFGLAQTHQNLGISYRDLGFDADADAHFRRAMEMVDAARAAGVARAETDLQVLVGIAETERALLRARAGDGALAGALARRALQRFRDLGEPWGQADALRVLAAAARAEGRGGDARGLLDEALAIAREHNYLLPLAEVQRDRGLLLRDTGDAAGAVAALTDSAAHFRT